MIFLIITALNITMSVFTAVGLMSLCVKLLSPVLRVLGIGPQAGTLTIVGMVMGISYGGGMIMHEVRSGRVPDKDIFASLSLMGLSHAVVEDTLLMAMLGGHVSGILWGRLLFTLVVMVVLTRIVAHLGDAFFYRHLFKPVKLYGPSAG
jgi:spore maturation protein SpmB